MTSLLRHMNSTKNPTFTLEDYLALKERQKKDPSYAMDDRDWKIYFWADDYFISNPLLGANPHSLKESIAFDLKTKAHEMFETLIQKAELFDIQEQTPRSAMQLEATRAICEALWAKMLNMSNEVETPSYPRLQGSSSVSRLLYEFELGHAKSSLDKAKD